MSVKIEYNQAAMKALENAIIQAASSAGEEVYSDLVSSQTMPFDTGILQNDSTFSECKKTSEGVTVTLVSDTPYARRLYYHPEYNFQQGKNANAGGEWLEPYIKGDKSDVFEQAFLKEFVKRSGV